MPISQMRQLGLGSFCYLLMVTQWKARAHTCSKLAMVIGKSKLTSVVAGVERFRSHG